MRSSCVSSFSSAASVSSTRRVSVPEAGCRGPVSAATPWDAAVLERLDPRRQPLHGVVVAAHLHQLGDRPPLLADRVAEPLDRHPQALDVLGGVAGESRPGDPALAGGLGGGSGSRKLLDPSLEHGHPGARPPARSPTPRGPGACRRDSLSSSAREETRSCTSTRTVSTVPAMRSTSEPPASSRSSCAMRSSKASTARGSTAGAACASSITACSRRSTRANAAARCSSTSGSPLRCGHLVSDLVDSRGELVESAESLGQRRTHLVQRPPRARRLAQPTCKLLEARGERRRRASPGREHRPWRVSVGIDAAISSRRAARSSTRLVSSGSPAGRAVSSATASRSACSSWPSGSSATCSTSASILAADGRVGHRPARKLVERPSQRLDRVGVDRCSGDSSKGLDATRELRDRRGEAGDGVRVAVMERELGGQAIEPLVQGGQAGSEIGVALGSCRDLVDPGGELVQSCGKRRVVGRPGRLLGNRGAKLLERVSESGVSGRSCREVCDGGTQLPELGRVRQSIDARDDLGEPVGNLGVAGRTGRQVLERGTQPLECTVVDRGLFDLVDAHGQPLDGPRDRLDLALQAVNRDLHARCDRVEALRRLCHVRVEPIDPRERRGRALDLVRELGRSGLGSRRPARELDDGILELRQVRPAGRLAELRHRRLEGGEARERGPTAHRARRQAGPGRVAAHGHGRRGRHADRRASAARASSDPPTARRAPSQARGA